MKNLKKEFLKNSNGITLIALVITIIVLLILAGVTIATLTGENGLLQRATDAKTNSNDAQIIERIQLAYHSALILGQGNYTKESLMQELKNEFETGYDVDDSNNEKWIMKAQGQEVEIPSGEKSTKITFSINGFNTSSEWVTINYVAEEHQTWSDWFMSDSSLGSDLFFDRDDFTGARDPKYGEGHKAYQGSLRQLFFDTNKGEFENETFNGQEDLIAYRRSMGTCK